MENFLRLPFLLKCHRRNKCTSIFKGIVWAEAFVLDIPPILPKYSGPVFDIQSIKFMREIFGLF